MQPIETLEPLKRTACENLHKIRKWVKDNTTGEQRRQLSMLNCGGEFVSDGYSYHWSISDDEYIIYMRVGASDLGRPVNDIRRETEKSLYDMEIDGVLYPGKVQHSCAFTEAWPAIKSRILEDLRKIDRMNCFEA